MNRKSRSKHRESEPQFGPRARIEIAQAAARLIADEGLTDYAAAKRKAASSLGFGHNAVLPDKLEIEAALREHLALFQSETQPAALQILRVTALDVMRHLSRFLPILTGPIVTGLANEFTPIELEIISDDAKAIDFALLNADIAYETALSRHHQEPESVPIYCFEYDDISVELALFTSESARAARHGKRGEHMDIAALTAQLNGQNPIRGAPFQPS